MKELENHTTSRKKNLPHKELQAMRKLHNNREIIIKPADKGGSMVIMNTTDYIQEAQRQLLNPEHYKLLTSDPTTTYNEYIHHLNRPSLEIRNHQWHNQRKPTNKESKDINLLHATKKKKKKKINPGNPGRPIVNSIGSITEKNVSICGCTS